MIKDVIVPNKYTTVDMSVITRKHLNIPSNNSNSSTIDRWCNMNKAIEKNKPLNITFCKWTGTWKISKRRLRQVRVKDQNLKHKSVKLLKVIRIDMWELIL